MSRCSIPCKCPKGLFWTLLPKQMKYTKVKFNILPKAFVRNDLKNKRRNYKVEKKKTSQTKKPNQTKKLTDLLHKGLSKSKMRYPIITNNY